MEQFDILIVGAGAAGIAAAKAAYEAGAKRILLVDHRKKMGGVLLQCLHRGFGSGVPERMSGVEYANGLLEKFPGEILVKLETAVLEITDQKTALLSGKLDGIQYVGFEQLILATGCLEIPIGFLPVGGTRPKGIYTAGEMQERVNLCHQLPEGPVVILGSGDIGLIMAKHLAEKGIKIAAIVEQKEMPGGMARNRQELELYEIPIICSATVTMVCGEQRLTGVQIKNLLTGETQELACRTLLTAVGLRPDRSLIEDLEPKEWIHICGNCHRVHPMIEAVAAEGIQAGINAWKQILETNTRGKKVAGQSGEQ